VHVFGDVTAEHRADDRPGRTTCRGRTGPWRGRAGGAGRFA
jgi:hypothetical protein